MFNFKINKISKIILSKEKGFTLIEIVISLSVFTIGILALLGMQIATINGTTRNLEMSEAMALGDEWIETFVALPYTDAMIGGPVGPAGTKGPFADPLNPLNPPFDGKYTVVWSVDAMNIGGTADDDVRNIRLTISWPDRGIPQGRNITLFYTKQSL
ncbi:MAG: prepilin-type N-terminal cleavage/methylation domain-containing protein [Desulfobacterales bacterium]|nr:prepilin-type N-terminal cleavage/methylation domain-containing protein [Desulfobacterales bacterium]